MVSYTNSSLMNQANERIKPIAFIWLVAGLVAVIFAVWVFLQNNNYQADQAKLDSDISAQKTALADYSGLQTELTSLDAQSKTLHTVFDSQKNWNYIFGKVEASLYKKMKLTSFQIDDKNVLTITGMTPTYTDYARIYSSLNENYLNLKPLTVTKVEATDKTEGGISFSFSLNLKPEFLTDTSTK